jgi:hypothetical protein
MHSIRQHKHLMQPAQMQPQRHQQPAQKQAQPYQQQQERRNSVLAAVRLPVQTWPSLASRMYASIPHLAVSARLLIGG